MTDAAPLTAPATTPSDRPDRPDRPDREGDALRARLDDWRRAFDRSFAEPRREGDERDRMDVLGIRIAGAPFALNLADLAGLTPAMTPAPYPAAAPGLLGLIGHQGQVLPLYDLRTLLGQGRSDETRWWAVAKAAPLALALEAFDGQWRLAAEDRLHQRDATGSGWAVRAGGHLRPLIDLDGLIARLREDAAARASISDDKNSLAGT